LSNFNFTSMTPVEKGWSCDKKYCVTTGSGEKYLLRVSPEDRAGHIEMMFRMMQQVEDKDVPMCRPIEFGTCEQGVTPCRPGLMEGMGRSLSQAFLTATSMSLA